MSIWCQYNRYDSWDRYDSSKITQRSGRLYGNRALSDRSIATIAIAAIAEIEHFYLSDRSDRDHCDATIAKPDGPHLYKSFVLRLFIFKQHG